MCLGGAEKLGAAAHRLLLCRRGPLTPRGALASLCSALRAESLLQSISKLLQRCFCLREASGLA